MASIRTRTTKAGRPYYTVAWYDRAAKRNMSRTFHDRAKAVTLQDYLDANSNTLSLAVSAKRRTDASTLTVWAAVQDHLDRLRGVTEGTLGSYRRNMDQHLKDTPLAGTPVDTLTTEDIEAWVDSLTTKGGKPAAWKTRANQHAVVSAALQRLANTPGSPISVNVARGALDADDGEVGTRRDPVYLSKEDLRLIRDRITPRYRLFVWTLAASGLRFSEAAALRKRDLQVMDDGRAVIHVRRAWQKSGSGHVAIGPPKHHRRRVVAVNMELSQALTEHVGGLSPGGLVFTNSWGQHITSSKFHEHAWRPLMDHLLAEGLLDDQPVPHEIRHAHCTHLLQDGMPVHVVQRRLGHKDPQTTLRVYARITRADDVGAADAVDW